MNKDREYAKSMMILFYGLFFFSFFACLSFLIINIVIVLTPIECFDGLIAFINAFWSFWGCLLSFIFAVIGMRYENKYIDKEDYDVAVHKIRANLVTMFCSILVIAGVGISIFSGIHVTSYQEKRVYTRERWLNGDAERRGEIVSSFLWQFNLRSLDREEVDYYLGTPDVVSEYHYTYDLGYGMGCLSIDPSMLDIEFSATDQVVDYHIWST